MPIATDVANYLAGVAALSLTAGTNLFDVPFPEASQDQAVAVVETPGSEDDHAAGASLSRPLYEVPRFQVICRDVEANAATARALARSIRLNLNRLAATTIGDTKVLTMQSLQPPFYLSADGRNRHRYICNYEAKIVDVGST
jgi:minor capsid protein